MKVEFLPISINEGKRYYKDFKEFDVIFITGDPYYDHPLSGTSLLARLLERKNYKIGIIAQPIGDIDFKVCGKPKYFFCISSGLLDSMLANYTPMLKERENILVPVHAVIKYTQKIKELFKESFIVIGGVEATIRRFTHFDYKENKLRKGILNDSKADILAFGNAENSLLQILNNLKRNISLEEIEGISFRIKKENIPKGIKKLPSFEECLNDKKKFNKLTLMNYVFPNDEFIEQTNLGFIKHNKRSYTLSKDEMDFIYASDFTRKIHPKSKNYDFNKGMVARLETSVVIGRGCFGSCNFCIIPLVQGKEVANRSIKSITSEINKLYQKGYKNIIDLTIPTLNMYESSCKLYNIEKEVYSFVLEKKIVILTKEKGCNQKCCDCSHRVLNNNLSLLLDEIDKIKGISLELRSAIRHDLILKNEELFKKILKYTKRLKIAPENLDDHVLTLMNKSNKKTFEEFLKKFNKISNGKNLVPYFVVAHPGSTIESVKKMKEFCEKNKLYVNLTQVFTPTPGTLSTAMYYSNINPYTNEKIIVPNTFREKKDQKNILFSKDEFIDENG